MDTTETNIKMCEKARKYLPKWKPAPGDFYAAYRSFQGNHLTLVVSMNCDVDNLGIPKIFPLYRQDQLQEMISFWTDNPVEQALKFAQGVYSLPLLENTERKQRYYFQFTSMEQLWLAFVMKEKYNKVWNGDVWIDGH